MSGLVPACPPETAWFEQHGVESLGRGVDGSRQACGPRADDRDLARLDVVLDVDTDGAREISQMTHLRYDCATRACPPGWCTPKRVTAG
jgi:hypothetical protein